MDQDFSRQRLVELGHNLSFAFFFMLLFVQYGFSTAAYPIDDIYMKAIILCWQGKFISL
jgi:hypothetical protein